MRIVNRDKYKFRAATLSELECMYQKTYGHSFAQSVLQSKCTNMQMKPTALEKMKAKRQIQRECRDQISQQFHTTDALTVLAEAQSLASYQRQRLTQSFESPQCTRARVSKAKKHSPKFENVQWDKEHLLVQLKNWPQGQIINWSALAREFNIPGRNNGQVVKEFAVENGIDVFMLDHRPSTTRLRARKLRRANICASTQNCGRGEGGLEENDRVR